MLCEVEKCGAFTVGVLRKFLCPVQVERRRAADGGGEGELLRIEQLLRGFVKVPSKTDCTEYCWINLNTYLRGRIPEKRKVNINTGRYVSYSCNHLSEIYR